MSPFTATTLAILPLLERADAIGRAGDPRGVDRQRAQRRVRGEAAFLHRAAGVAAGTRPAVAPPDVNANGTPAFASAAGVFGASACCFMTRSDGAAAAAAAATTTAAAARARRRRHAREDSGCR